MFPHCRGSLIPSLLMELNLERTTWQLLYALYTDRVEAESCADDDDMVTDIIVRNCHCSPVCSVPLSQVEVAQIVQVGGS